MVLVVSYRYTALGGTRYSISSEERSGAVGAGLALPELGLFERLGGRSTGVGPSGGFGRG